MKISNLSIRRSRFFLYSYSSYFKATKYMLAIIFIMFKYLTLVATNFMSVLRNLLRSLSEMKKQIIHIKCDSR